ncbi:MAG: AAA family ATPase [Chlamydiia bacterium]|nr:AAA family ATPase [Chlamydiia bacterium]
MLKTLTLKNFALIEEATIHFEKGFHVLTGETGAGKTLLIQAIHLLTGQKVTADLIRSGEDKGIIQASFDIEKNLPAQQTLQSGGIEVDPTEELVIKREALRTAKNRIFINGEIVSLSLLARLGPHLLELVGQNTTQTIRDPEVQLSLLDTFASLQKDKAALALSYQKKQSLTEELAALKREKSLGILPQLQEELEEWEDLEECDEEALFNEYRSYADGKERGETLSILQSGLESPQLIPLLSRFEKLSPQGEVKEHLSAAISHLQEASFLVSKEVETLDLSPQRLKIVEKNLSSLNRLKKKANIEGSEIPSYLENLKKRIATLETLDEKIERLEEEAKEHQKQILALAKTLSTKRRKGAEKLEKQLAKELHALNFPKGHVRITFEEKPLGSTGVDRVTFLLASNPGEPSASLMDQASGGEVARFLFALKLILAKQGGLPTLIFDEIDANVGGETATRLGEKLQAIGKETQIIAITHFPQVARFAAHHLHIAKKEKEGRTLTTITPLTSKEKDQELLRMLGGTPLQKFPR